MLDVEIIRERYQKMDTNELLRLSKNFKDLREDVIPILISELKRRGEIQIAEKLLHQNEEQLELNYQGWSMLEIQQMVEERLQLGENIESIKIDLKENGIDIFDVLKEEVQYKEGIFQEITDLKEEGVSHAEIDEHLKNTYNIEKSEADKLKSDLKVKGKRNETIGFILIIISSIFILISIMNDENYRGIGKFISLFIAGFSIYILGRKQLKD